MIIQELMVFIHIPNFVKILSKIKKKKWKETKTKLKQKKIVEREKWLRR